LLFGVVAFGGAATVLLSAPAHGDASTRGNTFGLLALLLWTGYVVSTRYFRRDMDVATFLAAACPIATLAVLPLALVGGGLLGMSGTGWTCTLLLTLLTGVAAHGLLVFAQRTIQIGTIGVSQVVQPPLAVTWSFLLLGERLRLAQAVGIAVAVAALLAFLLVSRRPHPAGAVPGPPSAGPPPGPAR
jgi:drug/metabolite transporter (DMT)-like permease